jgi:hypothetical protein
MISCGTLSCKVDKSTGYSSSPDVTAWLLISSGIEISSAGLSDRVDVDLGLLGRDDGSAGVSKTGVEREGADEVGAARSFPCFWTDGFVASWSASWESTAFKLDVLLEAVEDRLSSIVSLSV